MEPTRMDRAIAAMPVMAVVFVVVMTGLVAWRIYHPLPQRPCDDYANVSMQDVPARCVRYFQEPR